MAGRGQRRRMAGRRRGTASTNGSCRVLVLNVGDLWMLSWLQMYLLMLLLLLMVLLRSSCLLRLVL